MHEVRIFQYIKARKSGDTTINAKPAAPRLLAFKFNSIDLISMSIN